MPPKMLYLQKRDHEQAFWEWAAVAPPHTLPFVPLKELVTKDRVKVSEPYARRVLDFLHVELQMPDDETPNIRCPVEVFNEDGQPLVSSTDSDLLRLFSVTATAMYRTISFCRNERTLWRKVDTNWDLLGVKPDGQFVVGSPRRDKHMMVMAPPIEVKPGATKGQHGVRIHVPRAPGPSCIWYATPEQARAAYRETVERERNLGVPGIVQVEHVEDEQPVAREFITRRLPNYG